MDHSSDTGMSPLALEEIFNATVEPGVAEPEERLSVAPRNNPQLKVTKARTRSCATRDTITN